MPKKAAPFDLTGLRDAITQAGSQSELARLAGCGQQTISDIIHRRRKLTLGMALKVAKATGIPPHRIHPDFRASRSA